MDRPENNESSASTLFLGSADVERAFSWAEAIGALRRQYGAQINPDMFPPRTMARGEGVWLRTLSGLAPDGGVMGAKLIAANTRFGRASYLIPLFDQSSVELLALIDGSSITGFRTAATTALAIDALTPAGSLRVGLLGTGFEACNHARALVAIRDIESLTVFSPNPASRTACLADLAPLGLQLEEAASAQELVEAGPNVLICAARSRGEQPLFNGAWLRPGTTIASIGSTLPEQRELDELSIERAGLIVADMVEEVSHDTGDMRAARAAGVAFEHKLVSLADVVGGQHAGRSSADEIILYKSVGAALQDITVAAMCLERAQLLGLGVALPQTIQAIQK